jgi:hypothetical protein
MCGVLTPFLDLPLIVVEFYQFCTIPCIKVLQLYQFIWPFGHFLGFIFYI